MTRDDIIRMARETGLLTEYNYREIINFGSMVAAAERNRTWTQDHWTEYERSIAAAEREACIRDCDSVDLAGADDCIAAIRARGQ